MTLAASPETDLAVAKACGMLVEFRELDDVVWASGRGVFAPSTDLNDAVFAGMKCRLWNHHRICYDAHHGSVWMVYDNEDDRWVYKSESLPLAICEAILRITGDGSVARETVEAHNARLAETQDHEYPMHRVTAVIMPDGRRLP